MESIAQYLLTFPIRAACFISNRNKSKDKKLYYYDEYFFSQLLMEWVQNNKGFDGISYQSALPLLEIQKGIAYNVAIPVREVDIADGYDIRLKKIFKVAYPVKVDMVKKFKTLENSVKLIEDYAIELEEKLMVSNASMRHPYYEILLLCNQCCRIYSQIINENNENLLEAFWQIQMFSRTSLLIRKTINNVQTAQEWVGLYKLYRGDTILQDTDYDEILKKFEDVNSVVQKIKGKFFLKELNEYGLGNIEDMKFI